MKVSESYINNVFSTAELPKVNGMQYMEGLQKVYGEAPVKQAVQNIFRVESSGMNAFKTRFVDALADDNRSLNGLDQKYLANCVQRASLGV